MAVHWETCPICYGGDVNCPDNCDSREGRRMSDLNLYEDTHGDGCGCSADQGAAARRWDALDSDENVEVAAKAMLGPYRWEREGPRQVWKELARVALRAVKAGGE